MAQRAYRNILRSYANSYRHMKKVKNMVHFKDKVPPFKALALDTLQVNMGSPWIRSRSTWASAATRHAATVIWNAAPRDLKL